MGDAPAAEGLGERIRRLEDERDIRRVIELNWLLADAGPAEAFTALYTEDCVVDLGRLVAPDIDTVIHGHAGVRARYTDPDHAAWEGRSHHLSAGPQPICITGDTAEAITYAMTTMFIDGAPKLFVTGFNFWKLRREGGRWRIYHRIARRLGDSDVCELFKPVVWGVLGEMA
jgi:hypothetical protein